MTVNGKIDSITVVCRVEFILTSLLELYGKVSKKIGRKEILEVSLFIL